MSTLTRKHVPFRFLADPTIAFARGTQGSYSLAQHITNPYSRPLTYSADRQLPAGHVLNASTGLVSYDGNAGALPLSGLRFNVTDGTHNSNTSLVTIAISVPPTEPPPNLPPVWAAVPQVNLLIGTPTTVNLAPFASDPEGDPMTFTPATPFPPGTTLSADGILGWDGVGDGQSSTTTVRVDCTELNTRLDLLSIPEIAFVTGMGPQKVQLGPFIVDTGNPWPAGDLTRQGGWLTRASHRPTLAGTLPAGCSYNATTGELSYTGLTAAGTSTVQLVSTSDARTFRVRVLDPTIIWGRNALTFPQNPLWAANPLRFEPTAGTQTATLKSFFDAQAPAPQGTDAAPNVFLTLGGSYNEANDGQINGRPRKFWYFFGEPGNRPLFTGGGSITFTQYELVYFKNFEFIDTMISWGTCDGTLSTKLYLCDMFDHDRTGNPGTTSFSSSNQEDEGGEGTGGVISNYRGFWVWASRFVDTGGFDNQHVFYLHGRPGGEGVWVNNEFLGGRGGQQIKTTLPKVTIVHNRMWAVRDPANPTLGGRPHNLVDQVNVAEVVIYGNDFVGAFDNLEPDSQKNGVQNGMIFLRRRRELKGSDAPAYPDIDFTNGITNIAGGGYFPGNTGTTWVQGFDGTTATFKSAAFWAAVGQFNRAILAEAVASPYAFKHWIAGNKFRWVGGNQPRDAIRNDGTYAVMKHPTLDQSIALEVVAGWQERAADFLLNNDFEGWEATTVDTVLNYDDTDTITVGSVTTGVMKWPRTGTRTSNPSQFPQWVDCGGNGFLAQAAPVSIPDYFQLGGSLGGAGSTPTTLSIAASSFSTGFSQPLVIPSLSVETARLNPEDTLAFPDVSSAKRTFHWASKGGWDPQRRRVVTIHSPHIENDNALAQLMAVYDEATNVYAVAEDPLGGYTVGHMFDTFDLDVATRRWFKYTLVSAQAFFAQPQLVIGSLDFPSVASCVQGGSRTRVLRAGIIPDVIPNETTAPACGYFPGVGFCLFHRDSLWVIDVDSATESATLIDGAIPFTGSTFHHIGHYHPGVDGFIFGGGSYAVTDIQNLAWHIFERNGTIRRLDDSPVCMSVNTDGMDDGTIVKACAVPYPNSTKSVFFHNNGNIYTLDTTANTGQQWQVIVGAMDPDNAANNDRWCVAIPDYNAVLLWHWGIGGTTKGRLFRL